MSTSPTRRFAFRPKFWRENFDLEAELRNDDRNALISAIFYRRPYVMVIVDATDAMQYSLQIGEHLTGKLEPNPPPPKRSIK